MEKNRKEDAKKAISTEDAQLQNWKIISNKQLRKKFSLKNDSTGLDVKDLILSFFEHTYKNYLIWMAKRYYFSRHPKSNVSFERIYKNITIDIGKYSYSGSPIRIYVPNPLYRYTVEIGSFSHIGENLQIIISQNHTPDLVSNNLQTLFLDWRIDDDYYNYYKEEYGDIEIGHDVWIGNDVTLLGGIKIGNGSIIGAKSLVNKDVEPYSIVAGIPAKFIKYRFDSNIIKKLQAIAFWKWDDREILSNLSRFYNVNEFIERYFDKNE